MPIELLTNNFSYKDIMLMINSNSIILIENFHSLIEKEGFPPSRIESLANDAFNQWSSF